MHTLHIEVPFSTWYERTIAVGGIVWLAWLCIFHVLHVFGWVEFSPGYNARRTARVLQMLSMRWRWRGQVQYIQWARASAALEAIRLNEPEKIPRNYFR